MMSKYGIHSEYNMNNFLKTISKSKKKKDLKGVNTGKEKEFTRLILKTYSDAQKEMSEEYKLIHEENKEFSESYKFFEQLTKKQFYIEDTFKDLIVEYKHRNYKIPDFSTRHNLFTPSPLLLHNRKINDFYKDNPVRSNINYHDPKIKLTSSEKSKKYLEKLEKILSDKKIIRRKDEDYVNFRKKMKTLSRNSLINNIDLSNEENGKSRKEYKKEINDLKEEINNTKNQIKEAQSETEELIKKEKYYQFLRKFKKKNKLSKKIKNEKNTSNRRHSLVQRQLNLKRTLINLSSPNKKNIKNNNMSLTQTTFQTSLNPTIIINNHSRNRFNYFNNVHSLNNKTKYTSEDIENYTIESFEQINNKNQFLETAFNYTKNKIDTTFFGDVVNKYCNKFLNNEKTFDQVLKNKNNPIMLLNDINTIQGIVQKNDICSSIITSDKKIKSSLKKIKSLDVKIFNMDKKLAKKIIDGND